MTDISLDYVDGVEELWLAAYNGDAARLQELVVKAEYKARINHTLNFQRAHSPLFYACYGAGNASAVQVLLDAGADPYQRDNRGFLPLHYAANSLNKSVIDTLLSVPEMLAHRLDDKSSNGQTPVHAIFLPNLGVTQTRRAGNENLMQCMDSMLEPNRDVSKRAFEKQDHNGVSSFMLVKHYGLNPHFSSVHTPPKMFENFLKRFVSVPGNINDLVALNSSDQAQVTDPACSIETRIAMFAEVQKTKQNQEGALVFSTPEPAKEVKEIETVDSILDPENTAVTKDAENDLNSSVATLKI